MSFFNTARDNTRWAKAKKIMLEKGGGLVFEVLKGLLLTYAKQAVTGAPGPGVGF